MVKNLLSLILFIMMLQSAGAWEAGAGAIWKEETEITESDFGFEAFLITPLRQNTDFRFGIGVIQNELLAGGDFETNWIDATLNFHFTTEPLLIYCGAGFGWYRFDVTVPKELREAADFFGFDLENGIDTDAGDALGTHARAGVSIPLSPEWLLNIDCKYIWLKTRIKGDVTVPFGDTFAAIDTKGDLSGLTVFVGLVYRFRTV